MCVECVIMLDDQVDLELQDKLKGKNMLETCCAAGEGAGSDSTAAYSSTLLDYCHSHSRYSHVLQHPSM